MSVYGRSMDHLNRIPGYQQLTSKVVNHLFHNLFLVLADTLVFRRRLLQTQLAGMTSELPVSPCHYLCNVSHNATASTNSYVSEQLMDWDTKQREGIEKARWKGRKCSNSNSNYLRL